MSDWIDGWCWKQVVELLRQNRTSSAAGSWRNLTLIYVKSSTACPRGVLNLENGPREGRTQASQSIHAHSLRILS